MPISATPSISEARMSGGSRLAHLAGFVAITAGLTFFALVRVPRTGPVLCTFKNLTGVGCPGCGLTRSLNATMHLELATAFRDHAFGPPLAAVAIILWGMLGWSLAARRSVMPDPNSRRLALTVLGASLALIAYWIVRMALHAVP